MQEIAEDVFQIPLFPRHSINAYIAEGLLIDAGIRSSGKKLLKAIDTYGRHKIKTHVLTLTTRVVAPSSVIRCKFRCGVAKKM